MEYLSCKCGTVLILLLFAVGCSNARMDPIPGLWGVPIVSPTPLPTPVPTATLVTEPPIIITPQSGVVDSEARFILTIIVEDEEG